MNVHNWWHKCVEMSSAISHLLFCVVFFSLPNCAFINTFKISFHFYSFGFLVLAAVALRGPQTMQLYYFLGEINQIGNQLIGW